MQLGVAYLHLIQRVYSPLWLMTDALSKPVGYPVEDGAKYVWTVVDISAHHREKYGLPNSDSLEYPENEAMLKRSGADSAVERGPPRKAVRTA